MEKRLAWVLVVGFVLGFQSLAEAGARNFVKFGSDLVVEEGTRARNAVAIGGDVTVNGMVERDVVAIAGSVLLGPKAVVGKNVVSVGGTIETADEATVRGELTEVNIPGLNSLLTAISRDGWEGLRWVLGVVSFIAFIGFLAFALLVVALLSKPIVRVSTAIEDNALKATLWGLLGTLLIVPLGVFLAISVVGIVLIPVEIALVICAYVVGYIAAARLVGKKIAEALRRPEHPMLLETLLGLIILWIIGWVPVLGWAVKAVASLLGLGGVIVALLHIGRV